MLIAQIPLCWRRASRDGTAMLPHGLEPWTSRLLAEHSNQLSYESYWAAGHCDLYPGFFAQAPRRTTLLCADGEVMCTRMWSTLRKLWSMPPCAQEMLEVTAVGLDPTPFRTGALSQHLRPLGQNVLPMGHGGVHRLHSKQVMASQTFAILFVALATAMRGYVCAFCLWFASKT